MLGSLVRALSTPHPLRTAIRVVVRKYHLLSYAERVALGAVNRPHYAHIVWHAAELARKLGVREVAVAEMGVAGGNGLLALQRCAEESERATGVSIQVFGFDGGAGLPAVSDPRDLPYWWQGGQFHIDVDALRARLDPQRTTLVLGDVAETTQTFGRRYHPAPLGAIAWDLDLYTSTRSGFALLHGAPLMPRVFCYFDDVTGTPTACHNDRAGERLAIREFNVSNDGRLTFEPAYYLESEAVRESWHAKVRVLHHWHHPQYSQYLGCHGVELPLTR